MSAGLIFFSGRSRHIGSYSYKSEFIINLTSKRISLSRYDGSTSTESSYREICSIMNELTLSIGAFNSVLARLVHVDKLFVHFPLINYFNI